MTPSGGRETRIVRCPGCRRYYRVPAASPTAGARLRCTKCGEVFALGGEPEALAVVPPPVPIRRTARVLVATDGPEFRALIDEVLRMAGFELRLAGTGEEAWEAVGAWRPQVMLLDVALPGLPSFEVCERVRARPSIAGTGIILIASVFQQTRYKRAPTSLYGADDYVEKHHIHDRLPEKIARLLPGAAAIPAPLSPPTEGGIAGAQQAALVREELPPPPPAQQRQGLGRLQESLRRFARIIVSDIALYNQDLVERGIREGTFTELLAQELEEGRRLYRTRFPPGAADAGYFEEAVREFIAGRAAGGAAGPARRRVGHGRG